MIDDFEDGLFKYKQDWRLRFWIDLKSPYYKSIAIGWFMVIWCFDDFDKCLEVEFMPTGKTFYLIESGLKV